MKFLSSFVIGVTSQSLEMFPVNMCFTVQCVLHKVPYPQPLREVATGSVGVHWAQMSLLPPEY